MKDWLYPGARVVCVDDSSVYGAYWESGAALIKGRVYTISAVYPGPVDDAFLLVELEEVRRGEICLRVHGHRGYAEWRFRPLRKRTTSIEVFEGLLAPAEQKEDAL